MKRNKQKLALLCGLLGCLCYGGGDWLMMYGDPGHAGALIWLTNGTAQIPLWRYDLAMALAFPGILLYGIALFAVETYIRSDKERKVYHYLNAFGLMPWIALHLFYVMILVLFSWMNANGFAAEALTVCEGLFSRLSWLVPASEDRENGLSEGHGLYQCAAPLCHLEGLLPSAAGQRVSFGLHQRSDE